MRGQVRYLTFLNMLSVFLLALSGLFGGALGKAVYVLSFALPFSIGVSLFKKVDASPLKFHTGRVDLRLSLPLVFPIILLIFGVSALTSLVLGIFGFNDSTELSGSVISIIFNHALMPSLLEEAFFRFIPLAFLKGRSKRAAIILSSVFFAFAHCNLFQLPYAFLAGVCFALVDIAFDSIIPSLTIHFLNNTLSIFWMLYGDTLGVYFVLGLVLLAILSFVFVWIYRTRYAEIFKGALAKGEKINLSYELVIFIVMTAFVAFTNLFSSLEGV